MQAALDATDAKGHPHRRHRRPLHTLSFAGYPVRGNAILGKVHGGATSRAAATSWARDQTGLPTPLLVYANGPGYPGASDRQPEGPKKYPHSYSSVGTAKGGRPNLTDVDTENPDYLQEAPIPLKSESHGGEDVAIFARGPGAASFHGEIEQNVIFHLIAQHDTAVRAELCRLGACDRNGIPCRAADARGAVEGGREEVGPSRSSRPRAGGRRVG